MTELATVTTRAVPRRLEIPVTDRDISSLSELLSRGYRVTNEPAEHEAALSQVVAKPWGYECRVFVEDFLDAWHLTIAPGHGTSMHAHPRKSTQLLCLAGGGVTETLTNALPVEPGTVLHIARGPFHSTRATGNDPLHLVEVESPRNK